METLLSIFLITGVGYLLGKITIKGVSLGSACILMVALVFGHFGIVMDPLVRNLGLVLFVGSVGLIAGPVFISNFKSQAGPFIIIGFVIVGAGIVTAFVTSKLLGLSTGLAMGILSGALTSTPGLAAALELNSGAEVSVGYGVTYLFGVIGVVLFVQLLPKILKRDMATEVAIFQDSLKKAPGSGEEKGKKKWTKIEPSGLFVFSVTMLIGILLGMITIPMPGGGEFSLGATGGTLFLGVLIGHMKHIGKYSLQVEESTLHTLQELGLVLFLIGAGSEAGQGFIETVNNYGVEIFLQGALVTLLPMLAASFVAMKVLKLNLLTMLGAICGGMTSTPSLGALVSSTKTDEVAIPYAATYPVGMIMVVFGTQIINGFL